MALECSKYIYFFIMIILILYHRLQNTRDSSLIFHQGRGRKSVCVAWNNGKEVPRWWVAEIQKMSPSTTGRWGQPTNRSAARRHGSQSHGFAVQVWSTVCICSPVVVELVRSNLAPDFPLFHGPPPQYTSTQVLIHVWRVC